MEYDESDETSVDEEYVTHIREIMPKNKKISRNLLNEFLDKISKNDSKFPILVEEMATWLDQDNSSSKETSIKRLILPNQKNKGRSKYVEGRDYILKNETTKGRPKGQIYLSVDCFKKLCFRMTDVKLESIRDYFRTTEEAYRSWGKDTIRERRLYEDPLVTKKKIKENEDETFYPDEADGNAMFYVSHFKQKNPITGYEDEYSKFGQTEHPQTRLAQHKLTYPGEHTLKVAYSTNSTAASAIEQCYKNLARKHIIPCKGSPCPKEVHYDKGFDSEAAFKSCLKGIEFAEQEYAKSTKNDNQNSNEETEEKPCHLYFKTKKGSVRNLGEEFKNKSESNYEQSSASNKKTTKKY